MARLKVKQISDFTTEVQSLIDNDTDQNAGKISSALSAGVSAGVNADGISTALSNEVSATNSDVTSIDVELGNLGSASDITAISNALSDEISATGSEVTSLDTYIDSVSGDLDTAEADIVSVSNALSNEISATGSEVTSLDTYADGISAALSNEISATGSEVTSIDVELGNLGSASDLTAVSTQVSGILDGADVNMDNFAEVISYINSVDDASDLDLVAELLSVDNRISTEISTTNSEVISLDTYADGISGDLDTAEAEIVSVSNALSNEISATNSDVTSIDVELGNLGSASDITAISTALSNEISATGSEVTSLDTYIDAVSADLDTAEADIVALEAKVTYLKQGGLPASGTQFRISQGVKIGANDDLSVFINGLEIHPVGLSQLGTSDPSEFGANEASSAEGYTVAVGGTTFTLAGLGYQLEATDHVHVIGIKA